MRWRRSSQASPEHDVRWRYPLKTLPRPTGAATHVIITEYDLPRVTIEPHDVYRDAKGMIWFSDFGESLVGQLDPSTGKEREFPLRCSKDARRPASSASRRVLTGRIG